mmetsp:Transcript_27740/g.27982  ORF Transcript_27740/g.27982 Transcript_27740/m.27982 type:complete len:89 (-) Transcript_27740:1083-1349(-)
MYVLVMTIGEWAFRWTLVTALREFVLLKFRGSTAQIRLESFTSTLNVLVGAFVTVSLESVNALKASKERGARDMSVQMTVQVTGPANT